MKTKIKNIIIILFVLGLIAAGVYTTEQERKRQQENPVDYIEQAKQTRIEEIRTSQEFQTFINQELERRYYEELKTKAIEKLQEIQGTDEQSKKESAAILREYLAQFNPGLAEHADYIVTLPRWIEAVAISYKETHVCTAGVGKSRKNCGAIKNSLTGHFKTYRNQRDAIEDITILLTSPRYRNLSIAQMNGLYCQDASRPGRKCRDWDTVILAVIEDIKAKLS